MFKTEITIDGDRYFMCIPPVPIIQQIQRWAEEQEMTDVRRCLLNPCLACRTENGEMFSLYHVAPKRLIHAAFINPDNSIQYSSKEVLEYRPMLIPVSNGGIAYTLPEQDFPNGSITYGGSPYFKKKLVPAGHTMNITYGTYGKLTLSDTDNQHSLPFMAFHGCLFAMEPIVYANTKDLWANWEWKIDRSLWQMMETEYFPGEWKEHLA